jgi:hypothetical protein
MRTSEIANEPRASAAVQPVRDEMLVRRDEPHGPVPTGHRPAASGGRKKRAVYAGIAALVATACLVNAFSVNYDLTRVGRAHRLWEPFVSEATSAILLIALLALPRRLLIAVMFWLAEQAVAPVAQPHLVAPRLRFARWAFLGPSLPRPAWP